MTDIELMRWSVRNEPNIDVGYERGFLVFVVMEDGDPVCVHRVADLAGAIACAHVEEKAPPVPLTPQVMRHFTGEEER